MKEMNKEEAIDFLEKALGVGTEEYYLKGFRLARVIEALGGAKALDSYRFAESVNGLEGLGWGFERIKEAIDKEYSAKENND